MHRETRAERLERRARNAQQWSAWVNEAMKAEGVSPAELIKRTAPRMPKPLDKSAISHWANATNSADSETVILVALALNRDPVPALRAAGHHVLADQIVKLVEEALDGERLLGQGKLGNDRTAM